MIAGLPYVVHPASCRSCRPGRAPSWARTAGRPGTARCPCCPGQGERPRVCTWEEIRAQLWEVCSALGMRQQQLMRQQSSFPPLGKAEPGGDGGVCVG